MSAETEKNLLFFLSNHEGILPRLARGCVILRAPDRYVFCYVSVSPSPKNQFVVWDYCPPKEGGQFVMPDPCIAMFPPIAEMIYLKTLAVSILNSFNSYRLQLGHLPFACGSLEFENRSLERAREIFKTSHQEVAMFHFLKTFNSFNHYSMVAYPVGIHQDYFKHGKESLENKILFCLNPNFHHSIGRGGCIVGKSLCMHCWIGD